MIFIDNCPMCELPLYLQDKLAPVSKQICDTCNYEQLNISKKIKRKYKLEYSKSIFIDNLYIQIIETNQLEVFKANNKWIENLNSPLKITGFNDLTKDTIQYIQKHINTLTNFQ